METDMTTGKKYLLYLREQQELIETYILDCFKEAKNHKLSEQEIYRMTGKRFQCELSADDTENVILKGVVRNLLERYESRGMIIPVPVKYGPGYQLSGTKADEAA